MADFKREELEQMMADALTGRLSPEEAKAFEDALETDAELKATYEKLQATGEALASVYPEGENAHRQVWLRIEKSLGWRTAGEGGSRLDAAKQSSAMAQPLNRPDEGTSINNELAAERGQSLAQMSLAWCLRHPEVTSVLTAASRLEQVDDCVRILDKLEFTAGELARIEEILTD